MNVIEQLERLAQKENLTVKILKNNHIQIVEGLKVSVADSAGFEF